jgi:hypothetical protein
MVVILLEALCVYAQLSRVLNIVRVVGRSFFIRRFRLSVFDMGMRIILKTPYFRTA